MTGRLRDRACNHDPVGCNLDSVGDSGLLTYSWTFTIAEGVLLRCASRRRGRAAWTAGSEDIHDIAVSHCRPWRLRWHLGRAHGWQGRVSVVSESISGKGAYPTQQIVRDDIEAGHSYVLEEDGVVVATTVIGFTGEPVYDAIEGAWLDGRPTRAIRDMPCCIALRLRRGTLGRVLAASCCSPQNR